MENACWKCGDPTHHAKTCDKPVDVNSRLKREIQKYRKAVGMGHTSKMSFEKKQKLMANGRNVYLPHVSAVRFSVSYIAESLTSLKEELADIQHNTTDVSGSGSRYRLDSLELVRKDVLKQAHNVQQIGWATKQFLMEWPADDEINLLRDLWEDLHKQNKDLQNHSYVAINNAQIAIKMYTKINAGMKSIQNWLSSAAELYKGRPLEFNKEKKNQKKTKQEVEEWIQKFQYLFDQNDTLEMHNCMKEIQSKLTEVAVLFKPSQTDLDLSKYVCQICVDETKEWVLQCGHSVCSTCLDELKKTRTTEAIPVTVWNQTFQGNVQLPNGCPFCRGSLEHAIKLF